METSAEVADWGEQWVRSWVEDPSVPVDERERRAGIWRTLTLEEVMHSWHRSDERQIYGGQTAEEFDVNHAAGNHAALYRRERNGLLVWQAYMEYRDAGMPVPEAILEKFDEWARALHRAPTSKEVAAAIDMLPKGDGNSAVRNWARIERNRDIVRRVAQLVDLYGKRVSARDACRRVAQDYDDMTPGAVWQLWKNWRKKTRARQATQPGEDEQLGGVVANWVQHPRE
jgi:hypothetical protein